MNRETLLAAIKTKPLPIHSCSICGYQCSFYFVDEQFGYDSGCDCSRYPLMWTPRDVDELDFYLNEASWAETLREFVSTATPPAPSGRCKREIFDPPCDCCPPYGPLKDDQPSAPIGFNEFGNPNDPADFYPSASDERESSELERMKYWMNQYLQAYAPDFFNEPEGFTPKLDMNSAALVRRTLLKILNPSEKGKK